jgi:AraC-like DNA-binding protein
MFRTYRPSPPLAAHVACLWYADLPAPAADATERVLPNGAMQVVISLHDRPFRVFDRHDPSRHVVTPGAIVTGPAAEYSIISAADTASTVGVAFKPGGAAPFIGVPAVQLHDRDVDLATLWGRGLAEEVRARVLGATSPREMVTVLDEVLCRRRCERDQVHPAVTWAVAAFQRVDAPLSVAEVVERIGLSHQRFLALFHDTVGLTPKRFSRLQRFQAVLRGAAAPDAHTWADLAAVCGYSDQAHLTHDFRAFSGLTPSEYVRRRTNFVNHVTE